MSLPLSRHSPAYDDGYQWGGQRVESFYALGGESHREGTLTEACFFCPEGSPANSTGLLWLQGCEAALDNVDNAVPAG